MKTSCYLCRTLYAIFLFTAISIPSAAQIETKLQREIEATIKDRCEAMLQQDEKKANSFLASDYSVKLPNGKILTRQEIEKTSQEIQNKQTLLEVTEKIKKLKIIGTDVIVDVFHHESFKQKLKNGNDAVITNENEIRQTWIKTTDGWRIKFIEIRKLGKSTIDREKLRDFRKVDTAPPTVLLPNEEDKDILKAGNGLVFIFRGADGSLLNTSVFCNDQEIAELPRGTYLRMKLLPGTYQLKSEKEPTIELQVESGKIYFFELQLKPGFPAKGQLKKDEGSVTPGIYKSPKLSGLKPIEKKHIKDSSKIASN